jgi:ATP-binding cassette subfamily F protein 3
VIWLQGVTKGYGARTLFEAVDWDIKPNQRIGLVGPNGAGKTTLFSIITGELAPDGGTVRIGRDVSVGYLPQEIATVSGRTVREEARRGLERVLALGRELEALEGQLASATHDGDHAPILERYAELQGRFDTLGGFQIDARVEEVLDGLGFRRAQLERDCGELSGGWQMRVALGRLLLMQPDVLLLDEPTNHLDLETLVWLEGFLRDYRGTLVMISHDRSFLNALCTHIAELSGNGLNVYTGNFEDYLEQVAMRLAVLERQSKNLERRAAELQRFVDRFRYKASKAKQAQSRLKQLERLDAQRVDLDPKQRSIHFELPEPPRSGRVLLQLENVHKSWGENVVYAGLDVQLIKGQKIALVGPNGAGKSTLLKLFAGATTYQQGHRTLGDQTRPYYFAQHQIEALDLRRTVFEEAMTGATGQTPGFVRGVLGAFLFSGEDVEKRVGVLSGGEKNRLALAKMLLTPANLLLLDEPTNHLDMASCNVLEAALGDYTGSIVLISHDRHFIDGVVEEVWEVADGRVRPFLGAYDDYVRRKASGNLPEPFPLHQTRARPAPRVVAAAPPVTAPERVEAPSAAKSLDPASIDWSGGAGDVKRRRNRDDKRSEAELRQRRAQATRVPRAEVEAAEREVERLEATLMSLRAAQAEPSHYQRPEEVRRVAQSVAQAEASLPDAYARWEAAQAALEVLEAEFE